MIRRSNINKCKCLNFIFVVNTIKITLLHSLVRGHRHLILIYDPRIDCKNTKVPHIKFYLNLLRRRPQQSKIYSPIYYSINIGKLKQVCSHSGKIKTKDDAHKSPLKSNQSIIQLHNSTVTVNKKGQKEQNCTKLCAFKYGRR